MSSLRSSLAWACCWGLFPSFLGKSPFGAALRPMAPFGWLLFAAGCGLLWWQVRGRQPKAPAAVRPERTAHPRPLSRSEKAPPPVDRTPTEFDRMALQSNARSARPEEVPQSWSPEVFEVIEWRRFEALVEALFAQAGFQMNSITRAGRGNRHLAVLAQQPWRTRERCSMQALAGQAGRR